MVASYVARRLVTMGNYRVRVRCNILWLRDVPTYFREGVLKWKADSLAGGRSPPDADDNIAVTQPQITIIILLLSFTV